MAQEIPSTEAFVGGFFFFSHHILIRIFQKLWPGCHRVNDLNTECADAVTCECKCKRYRTSPHTEKVDSNTQLRAELVLLILSKNREVPHLLQNDQ